MAYIYIAQVKVPGSDETIVLHGKSVRDLGKKLNINRNTVLSVLNQKQGCRTLRNISISRSKTDSDDSD